MGGCCIKDCCVLDCGFCCIMDFSSCSDRSCCVGYNSGPNTTDDHAEKIATELAEKKDTITEEWKKQEDELMKYLSSEMNEFLQEMDGINHKQFGGKELNIDLDGVRAKIKQLKKGVVGSVGKVFDDRLVLTDPELSVILGERSDSKRAKNFDNFVKKIKREAIKNLRKKVQETLDAQNAFVINVITTRLTEVDTSVKQNIQEYEALVQAKKNKEAEAALQIKHVYIKGICDIITSEADNETKASTEDR